MLAGAEGPGLLRDKGPVLDQALAFADTPVEAGLQARECRLLRG
jgi:hypothetical protein